MQVLLYSIVATLIVSLVSLVGLATLTLKEGVLDKIVFYLVAISAGSFMGGAFLHLIPEAAIDMGGVDAVSRVFLAVLVGFAVFFILERVLHWHHCHIHGAGCHPHTFTYMNLIGDGFHNFIDGVVIAAAFSLSIELGIATTIGVITHEIPQEISDFGVLIYGGFSKAKALLFNFLSATLAILGAFCGVFISQVTTGAMPVLVAITAGGFIYIAATDLIPELHKESDSRKSIIATLCFFVGVGLMAALKLWGVK